MYMSHLLQKTLLTRCLSLSSPKNLALDFTDFVIALQHRDFANQEITQHIVCFIVQIKMLTRLQLDYFSFWTMEIRIEICVETILWFCMKQNTHQIGMAGIWESSVALITWKELNFWQYLSRNIKMLKLFHGFLHSLIDY